MIEDGEVPSLQIKSHSVIAKMVTKCLGILAPDDDETSTSTVLEIMADARVAGKAITITEIVKRRIIEHGGTISQTTRVQEKPAADVPETEKEGKPHLQGEGYEKPQRKRDAQIVIRLERTSGATTS